MFLVLHGSFRMDYRDPSGAERSLDLREGEFVIVPRGTEHRPSAASEVHVMLFEPASTLNTGNVRDARTVEVLENLYYHNVIVIMLGEFEYLLITSAARLGEEAYGAAIRQELVKSIGRSCSIGALYTTLDRLEAKGLVETWMGDATPQRGGRPKRMVRVTAKGMHAAADFYNAVMRVSRGASWAASRAGVKP
jgi:PadR family transcriptional regulator, regulatory protein PadR